MQNKNSKTKASAQGQALDALREAGCTCNPTETLTVRPDGDLQVYIGHDRSCPRAVQTRENAARLKWALSRRGANVTIAGNSIFRKGQP